MLIMACELAFSGHTPTLEKSNPCVGGRSTSTRQREQERRLVGWEGSRIGSRILIVAAEKMMAVLRKRWTRTGAAWAV